MFQWEKNDFTADFAVLIAFKISAPYVEKFIMFVYNVLKVMKMSLFREDTYYYDKNRNSGLFYLHSFGKLYPDPGYIIYRNNNPETIIEFVTEGKGYIEYEGVTVTVEKGDCYILKHGKGHKYYSDDKNPYGKIWITVSGKIIDDWIKIYNIDNPIFIREVDITPYYNQIKQIALGKDDYDNEKKLMLLVHNILFDMGMTSPKTAEHQKSQTNYIKTNDNILIDVKKYIEKNCNERLLMKDTAAKFGMSTNTLNKMFTEKYGISPDKYHMSKKLESAVYFLEYTDLPIDVISETTGFFDRSHFRKAFTAVYGVTPAKYRNQARQSKINQN